MDFKDFGFNLAVHRQKRNMSAYELSGRLGKSSGYISKVENHKINPTLSVILDIAIILEIDVRELFKPQNEK